LLLDASVFDGNDGRLLLALVKGVLLVGSFAPVMVVLLQIPPIVLALVSLLLALLLVHLILQSFLEGERPVFCNQE
jgi:hypothetical protein